MTRRLFILSLLALGLTACATYQKPLLDDAYYWPEKMTQPSSSYESNVYSPIVSTPSEHSIQYLNVQDTTVTIRIKR